MSVKKCVVLGVTGGIAAYKACEVASRLTKSGIDVRVIMTKNAAEFVSPTTFETLTGNRAVTDTFDRNFEWNVGHVSLAKMADVFLVAPATANAVAKFAGGIADDMLSTTILAAGCKKLIAPAMNTGMLMNPATRRNIETLRRDGFGIIEPESGRLACGDVGAGRLADADVIVEAVENALYAGDDMKGLSVMVTAGPTRESIDPVRFITNHSSGKMGYAIARAAARRGAEVTLISGPAELRKPAGVKAVDVVSAADMYDEVMSRAAGADVIIKAAAVADYSPAEKAEQKIKKSDGGLTLELCRTKDILKALCGSKRPDQTVCGFSMETENLLENSRRKLKTKNADMIVANSIADENSGFGTDTNLAVIITKNDEISLPCMTKSELADVILDTVMKLRENK